MVLLGFFWLWPAIFVGSVVWVWADAARLMKGLPLDARREVSGFLPTPGNWAFFCVLLWIVFFPLYLAKRGGYIEARQRLSQEPPGGPAPKG